MGDRDDEGDVAHAFAADFFLSNLDAAAVADDAFVADAFVFTAVAFIVFDRAENTFAEEAIALRFVSSVVNGLGLKDFAARLFKNLLGRSESDGDFRKVCFVFLISSKSHIEMNFINLAKLILVCYRLPDVGKGECVAKEPDRHSRT